MITPDQMREAAGDLADVVTDIDDIVPGLVTAGDRATWLGPAADAYRGAASTREAIADEVVVVLEQIADRLRAAADELELEIAAEQQRIAEDAWRARLGPPPAHPSPRRPSADPGARWRRPSLLPGQTLAAPRRVGAT